MPQNGINRIGIVVPSIGSYSNSNFYNVQHIGLAKSLCKFFQEINVYECIKFGEKAEKITLDGYENVTLYKEPVLCIGVNGLLNPSHLDKTLDTMFVFSDTQLIIPSLYRWSKKNKIPFYPYIGTFSSNSSNRFIRLIMNIIRLRNLAVYKKCKCFAKTESIRTYLGNMGVESIRVASVGLDFDLLKNDYAEINTTLIKRKLGFSEKDKVVLLIGRLESSRNVLDAIPVFKVMHSYDKRYKMLVVGKGSLREIFLQKLEIDNLANSVIMIESVNNRKMYEIYRIGDALISFNRNEVFGMSIAEAMFYELMVYVIDAPGPRDLIQNKISGYIYADVNVMKRTIINDLGVNNDMKKNAHERIEQKFSWTSTAKLITQVLKD